MDPPTPGRGSPRIGIISGAGPEAGVQLMQEVLSAQRRWLGESYRTDRDAPHVLLFQVPTIGGPRGDQDLFDEALCSRG